MTPLFASDRTSARLLDLPLAAFRAAVDLGALPKPRKIAGEDRWDVKELYSIARGDCLDGGDIKW